MSQITPTIVNKADTRKNLKYGFAKEDTFVKNFYSHIKDHLDILGIKKTQTTRFFYEVNIPNLGVSDFAILAWEGNAEIANDSELESDSATFKMTNKLKKYLEEEKLKTFIKNNNPTLYSFEMKLSAPRSCIQKAFQYSYYSHYSYTVMPSFFKEKLEKEQQTFKNLQLGSIIFTENKKAEVIYTQKKRKPRCDIKFFKAIERLTKAATIESFS